MNIKLSNIFNEIYISHKWCKEFTSGPGSKLCNTIDYTNFLKTVFENNNIKSVIDIGCGVWEHLSILKWDNIMYTGIDIVPIVIKHNKQYETNNIKFILSDIDNIVLNFDLAIIKDVFQHLSNNHIIDMLSKIKNIPNLLITNDIHNNNYNLNCLNGGFRKLNMELPPFNLKSTYYVDFKSYPNTKRCIFIKQNVLL